MPFRGSSRREERVRQGDGEREGGRCVGIRGAIEPTRHAASQNNNNSIDVLDSTLYKLCVPGRNKIDSTRGGVQLVPAC